MGWFDGIGRFIQRGAKQVERDVTGVEKAVQTRVTEVEAAVTPLWADLKFCADNFQPIAQHGVADPLLRPGAQNAEPEVYNDDPRVTYRSSSLPLYKDGAPQPGDVYQGGIGDCYLMASLASVASASPSTIINAIHDNGNGTYTVTLYEPRGLGFLRRFGWAGMEVQALGYQFAGGLLDRDPLEPVRITVTGKVPVENGEATYAQPTTALWPCIMEKAYAKLWGNYTAVGAGGIETVPLLALTGKPVDTVQMDSTTKPDRIWTTVTSALAKGQAITASSEPTDNTRDDVVGMHAYSVVDAYELNGERFVTLRNPWGWNVDSQGQVDEKDGGDITLPLSAFIRDYNYLCIAR